MNLGILLVVIYFLIYLIIVLIAKYKYKVSHDLMIDISLFALFWILTIWKFIPKLLTDPKYKDGIPFDELI